MTEQPAPSGPAPRPFRLAKTVALVGLLGMLVLWGFELQALTWESGDRVLHLNYIGIGICIVTTIGAAIWTSRTPRKGGAIAVLVISILINPIWFLLLIRAFG